MGTLPGNIVGDIEWSEQRVPSWSENPVALGLTAANITELTTELTQARSAYNAAQLAKAEAKDATLTQNTQVSDLRSVGSQMISVIRSFAQTQPDPNAVLALASIPAKQTPSSVPPETPYDIDFSLNTEGQIVLKWKGSTAGGTVFGLARSVQLDPSQPSGPKEQIAILGSREFVDSTIPACSVQVTYTVTAYKGSFSPAVSKPTTVRFTPAGDGFGGTLRVAA